MPNSCSFPPDARPETVDYQSAMDAQNHWVEQRFQGETSDLLWLLEHPPTITSGTSGRDAHVLLSKGELQRRGWTLASTRRGGDVTCHEPGQLVVYPIVALKEEERDLHAYLRSLEEALIDVLEIYGLEGKRIEGRTGVWLDSGGRKRKIAAMGVKCSRWITSHGSALNYENDLQGFRLIVPCGISDAGVTRIVDEVKESERPTWSQLCTDVHRAMESRLDRPLRPLYGPEGLSIAGGD